MFESSKKTPSIVWISGFSASGKTSVARKLVSKLRENNINSIHLDGDDLRAIFGNNWGYERADRIELSRVYFRLCSHLSAQGSTVVISAISMYQEVREWIRLYVPNTIEIYLDTSDDERRRRDKKLKNIYLKDENFESLYDVPDKYTEIIRNQGDRSVDEVAQEVYDVYSSRASNRADLGRKGHWAKFYASSSVSTEPSAYSKAVSARLLGLEKILEIGCGNGRDAEYFGSQGYEVVATDASDVAINNCLKRNSVGNVKYIYSTGGVIDSNFDYKFDIVYCRFVIHAMPLSEELELHSNVFRMLSLKGQYHIECRSINDPMAYQGEIISENERINGHYRRFIDKDELLARLSRAGFGIVDVVEGKGLATFGSEDPMVIRVTAIRG